MRIALRVFLTAKVVATVSAALGLAAFPSGNHLAQQGYAKPAYTHWFEIVFGAWERADAIWYLGIARNGYTIDPAAHAFMPLYPILIRLVDSLLPFPPIVAALILSHLAFLLGLFFFYRLALTEADAPTAERALFYLALFPGALFFFAPYTEALFFCLAVGSFLSARSNRWWLAGFLGLLLSLTRNVGVLFAAPLLLEWIRQRRAYPKKPILSTLLAIGLVPIGLMGWMAYCGWKSGDVLIFVHQQSQWQRQPLAP
ncbi:MAG: hypothetical protein KGQ59_11605, partial [Bdellovibrionales bacterium]|nr:hypothetical protein [Bdellovibrionales bacterium]